MASLPWFRPSPYPPLPACGKGSTAERLGDAGFSFAAVDAPVVCPGVRSTSMVAKIFIDGEAGTTGLQIRERLASRRDLELLSIAPEKRKDQSERQRLLNAADIAILCLPDDAARDSVRLIDNETTRVIAASSAHRTAERWTYGFAEMEAGQGEAIA